MQARLNHAAGADDGGRGSLEFPGLLHQISLPSSFQTLPSVNLPIRYAHADAVLSLWLGRCFSQLAMLLIHCQAYTAMGLLFCLLCAIVL